MSYNRITDLDIVRIRSWRLDRTPFSTIVRLMHRRHNRDEVVEAFWAALSTPVAETAAIRANRALDLRDRADKFTNGGWVRT